MRKRQGGIIIISYGNILKALSSLILILTFNGAAFGSCRLVMFYPFENDIFAKSFFCCVIACPVLMLAAGAISGFFWMSLAIVFMLTSLLLFFFKKLKIPEFSLSK